MTEIRVCFSATASFVAGGTLSVVGGVTLSRVQHRREVPFAHIPLLFGIQQIVEGFVWLGLTHQAPELKQTMTSVYSAVRGDGSAGFFRGVPVRR